MDVLVLDRGSPDILMDIENYDRDEDYISEPMSVEDSESYSQLTESLVCEQEGEPRKRGRKPKRP
jgi:hypothetical protein